MVEKPQVMTNPNPGAPRQRLSGASHRAKRPGSSPTFAGETFGNATAAARVAGYKWPNHSGPENHKKLRDLIDQAMRVKLYNHPEKAAEWVEGKLAELRDTELGKDNA